MTTKRSPIQTYEGLVENLWRESRLEEPATTLEQARWWVETPAGTVDLRASVAAMQLRFPPERHGRAGAYGRAFRHYHRRYADAIAYPCDSWAAELTRALVAVAWQQVGAAEPDTDWYRTIMIWKSALRLLSEAGDFQATYIGLGVPPKKPLLGRDILARLKACQRGRGANPGNVVLTKIAWASEDLELFLWTPESVHP